MTTFRTVTRFYGLLLAGLVACLTLPVYSAPTTPTPKANGKIAFQSMRNTTTSNSAIYTINSAGSNETRLTDDTTNSSFEPVYSPDGSKVAFVSVRNGEREQVYLMNSDASNQTKLANLPPDLETDSPTWSPDGTRLAFVAYSGSADVPAPGSGLYVINADGSNQVKITSSTAERDVGAIWSPDGAKIAFLRSAPPTPLELYVINADGSSEVKLLDSAAFAVFDIRSVAWSIDGTRIAFYSIPSSGPGGIFLINPDGSNLTRIASLANLITNVFWSPDGSKIAFHSNLDGSEQIYTIGVNGSNQTKLTSGPVRKLFPIWSPDGTKIAFTGVNDATATTDVYVINIDGSNETRVTSVPSFGFDLSWQPLNTPTGSNITVQSGLVTTTFGTVTAPGITTVAPIDPATAGQLPGQYTSANLAYEIKTTATYTGPIQICFNVPSVIDATTFSNLRVLHGEGGSLVDRTILPPDFPAPDFAARVLCARVSSLSPFVIALVPSYSISALYDQTKAKKSGSTIPIKLQLLNRNGANVSSASIVVTALSVTQVSTNAPGILDDAGNANPDYNFRYDSTLGGSGGGYIFNLKTTGYATGTYNLNFKAGSDPATHSVQFQVK